MIKGNFVCVICGDRFWDELDLPDDYGTCISFCLDCGNKIGLPKITVIRK